MKPFLLFFASISLLLGGFASSDKDFYSLTANDITGKAIDFSQYRGKIVLVVNVASECGYTDYNYEQLNKLQSQYGEGTLAVLAFPCNQFGGQEPGNDSQIQSLVHYKYRPRFRLFSKVDVSGSNRSEVYRFLVTSARGLEPSWNFCKYLLDQEGLLVQFFSERETFDKIYNSIDKLVFRKRREL